MQWGCERFGQVELVQHTSSRSGSAMAPSQTELAIDINYAKLPDWLVDRKQVNSDWRKRVTLIATKAESLLPSLPQEVQHLVGQRDAAVEPVDYQLCCKVRDAYIKTGQGEKTLFGGLKGPAGAWQKLCQAYEKGNVWMAESARFMVEAVDHEAPALRQQRTKAQQQIVDLERKHAEYLRSAANAAASYAQERKQLGIGTGPVASELKALVALLPTHLDSVVEAIQQPQARQAVEYYTDFVRCTGSATAPAVAEVLQEVADGRTAPWQPAPHDTSHDAQGRVRTASNTAAADTGADIDWDVGEPAAPGTALGGEEISWDIDVSATDAAVAAEAGAEAEGGAGAIDWDFEVVAAEMVPGVAASGAEGAGEGGIDWDIVAEPAAVEAEIQQANTTIEGPTASSAVAAGVDAPCCSAAAVRLAEDGEFRAALTCDVLELRAFLRQRSTCSDALLAQALDAEAPASLQISQQQVQGLLAAIERVAELLTGPRTQQLVLMKSSKQYTTRMQLELTQKAGLEAKCSKLAHETEAKRLSTQRTLMSTAPKLQRLAVAVKQAKLLLEEGLGRSLGGREVHVVGADLMGLIASVGT